MCCPLILCRYKTMSEAKRSNKVLKDRRAERWHDKRMRKKRCELGNKKLMNNSSYETSRTRKTSSKREKTITSHLPFVIWCHHAPMTNVTS